MEKILVIGSLNVDMVVNVDHTPVTGETILSNQMTMVPGGKGANQACALGCLGAEVTMLGAVGKDSYADMQRKSLGRAGVDVSHLVEKEGVSTGLAVVMVDCEGDNSIVVISGANMMLTPEDVDRNVDLIRQSDIVVLQLEIPLDTVCHAARMAKALGKTVILDPAPVPNVFPEELYQYVDIIKPNETELSRLTGIQNIDEEIAAAAGKLRGRGVKNVLVTLGDKGVYLDSEECGRTHIPAYKVRAVDTTAAGDSFTAALAVMLAQGKTIREAAEFANCVSAIVVTREGAQSSIPTLDEVMEYRSEIEKVG